MKGDPTVIEHLNRILTNELTAINQYFLHARMLKNWDILLLAEKIYQESLGEMNHADWLIDRILLLDGVPNLQDLGRLRIGETVPEMFQCDMGVETYNQTCLKEAIQVCEQVHDFQSREILTKILADTEEHIDWLESQIGLIETLGAPAYIQTQVRDKNGA